MLCCDLSVGRDEVRGRSQSVIGDGVEGALLCDG